MPARLRFLVQTCPDFLFVRNHSHFLVTPTWLWLRLQMLLKNLEVEGGLTNGTRGVVVGWSDHPHPLPRVRFTAGASVGAGAGAEKTVERVIGPEQWRIEEGGKMLAERRQLPLSWPGRSQSTSHRA